MMNKLHVVCLIKILCDYILIHLVTVYFGCFVIDYFTYYYGLINTSYDQ